MQNSQGILFFASQVKCKLQFPPCWTPWGFSLLGRHTITFFHQSEARISDVPEPVLSKQSSFHSEKQFSITASANCREQGLRRKMCLLGLQGARIFHHSLWYGELCVCLIWTNLCGVKSHILKHVYYTGFCYWLINLWPLKHHTNQNVLFGGRGTRRKAWNSPVRKWSDIFW